MKETVFLTVSRQGVQGIRKNLPAVRRGEIPVKLTITIPSEAFNPPVLSQDIVINDWRQGIDLEDVEFRQSIITPDEAEVIRQRRLEKMKEILEAQGYVVNKEDKE